MIGSGLVDSVAEYLRLTTYQPFVHAIVAHITGRSTWNNSVRWKQAPLDRLENYFTWRKRKGRPDRKHPKNVCCTYAIDPFGELRQFMSEDQRPWSQGFRRDLGGRRKIVRDQRSGKLEIPRWWHEHWTDVDGNEGLLEKLYDSPVTVESPLDLLHPKAKSPNWYTITIEFVLHGNQFRLTTAQYEVGSRLFADLCHRHKVDHNRLHCYGHEDVIPWNHIRSDSSGGWCPGAHRASPRFDWSAMLAGDIYTGLAIPTPERPDWMRR